MEVGGLYQITQLCFKGQGNPGSTDEPLRTGSSVIVLVAIFWDVEAVFPPSCLSFLSMGVTGADAPPAALLKSNAVPGVLGVLVADPNEAKAPDPNPKADDAPPVGEETPAVVKGAMLLKGFARLPCELWLVSARLDEEYPRGELSLRGSWFSPWAVEREILLELYNAHVSD